MINKEILNKILNETCETDYYEGSEEFVVI